MERRRFVLSWGRKIFFGLGWPLLATLGLTYLKSGVIPKDIGSMFYYVVTAIGHYGLLTTVLYCFCYVPVALIFPTYYFVRLWSAFLILITGAGILLDALVFGEYRFHINKLIVTIFSTQGPGEVFGGSMAPFYVTAGVTVFLFFVLWIRGEWTWRVMQRRFSNPVKNWYFLAILLCAGTSHLLWRSSSITFYGNEITLASVFPVNYQEIFFPKVHSLDAGSRASMRYPKKDLKCKAKDLPNIIVFALENMTSASVSEAETPFLLHLQQHGMNFTSHFTGSGSSDENLFRLLYGVPVTYRPEIPGSVLVSELEKTGYDIAVFSDREVPGLAGKNKVWESWEPTLKDRDPTVPFFLFYYLTAPTLSELDLKLKAAMTDVTRSKLLSGSTIIVTGTGASDWETVPLTMISSDRQKGSFNHRTTHYDLVPTLMTKVFHCKTSFSAYTQGKDLTQAPTRDWEIFGNENLFRIVDFSGKKIIEADWHGRITSGVTDRSDLVLKASREISRFYR